MDEIDEQTVPPLRKEDGDFQPYLPQKEGEEGALTKLGLKKKLLKAGQGWDWETPDIGDEITVNCTGTVLDGEQFFSSKEKGEPLVFRIGHVGEGIALQENQKVDEAFPTIAGNEIQGCDEGLITMRKGEIAIFTVPPGISHKIHDLFPNLPQDVMLQFEIELISWLKVVDICGDGGIIKRILCKSEILVRAKEKDEVTVKYEVRLEDGSLVAQTPEEGVEFLVSDGHFCPAIAKTVVIMRKGEKAILRVEPQYAFGALGKSAEDGLSAVPPNATVIISLELVAFKLLEYVTEDRKIVKKIISTVEGYLKPNSGTVAQIRYVGKLEDGTIFDKKGHDGNDPFEFRVDEEQIIEGLDLAVATMKQGEVALIIIDYCYGFGNTEIKTDLAVVPAFSTLYYEVELVAFTKVKESWDMEPEEKIEYALKRKEEGNAYFKNGKYQRASLRYDMATKYVEFESTFSEDQKKHGKFIKISCNLNNAACKLKLKEYREAAKLCSKVLKLESDNLKALFRRAQAYIETADMDLAELDLNKALEIDHDSREVQAEIARLKKLQSYYDKKESKLYANMIDKLKLSDPSECQTRV